MNIDVIKEIRKGLKQELENWGLKIQEATC